MVIETPNNENIAGNLYPNPTNSEANLDYTIANGNEGFLCLYDITGKLILKEKLSEGENKLTINTSQLKHGVYLYNVIVDKQMITTGKLVIIK